MPYRTMPSHAMPLLFLPLGTAALCPPPIFSLCVLFMAERLISCFVFFHLQKREPCTRVTPMTQKLHSAPTLGKHLVCLEDANEPCRVVRWYSEVTLLRLLL